MTLGDHPRLVLVDADPVTRDEIRAALAAADFIVVGEAATTEEAGRLIEAHEPQLALVDCVNLDRTGGTLVRHLKTRHDVSIVAMAPHSDPTEVADVVAGGASAYVLKADVEEVVAAVKAVAAGSGLLSTRVTKAVLDEMTRLFERERRRNEELQDLVYQLQSMSVTDWLTGLKNHGFFYERLEVEVSRAKRHRHPLSVLAVDIDDFKDVNDTFGHGVGDLVLQGLSDILLEQVRTSDLVCRTGGEEFGVILTDTHGNGARMVGERIRRRVEERDFPQVGRVTVSIGVGAFPETADTLDELVASADRALYLAKREGKNRSRIDGQPFAVAGVAEIARPVRSQAVEILVRVLRMRAPEMAAHAKMCAEIAVALGAAAGLSAHNLEHLQIAAQLQDVGKIAIPDSIHYKPGPLDDGEWDVIRDHPRMGTELLGSMVHQAVLDAIAASHERWDGAGYPSGLAGEEIPELARVMLIADAFVAMSSPRSFRDAFSPERIVTEIRRDAGAQFDPTLVDVMVELIEDGLKLGS